MKRGDKVNITCALQTVPGEVILASKNGRSLILGFEAILDGHVTLMPVLRCEDGSYQALLTGSAVLLDPRP